VTAARRIALVAACPFPSPQGSQVFVGQMAESLAAAGHDVHLLTYGQGAMQTGRGYFHHRIARLPGDDAGRSGPNLAKPALDAMLAARLVRLIREHGIEIVHAHNYEAAAASLVARARTSVPVVYHSHNLMGDELETYFASPFAQRLARLGGRLLDRFVPANADRTIALCDWSAGRLRELGVRPEALTVIPPAVRDEGVFAGDPREARRELGIGDDEIVVGYSGNLDAYQNLPLLFEAMRRLRGSGRTRLLIVTHAPADARSQLEAATARGGSPQSMIVEATGHADARRMEAAADILALPRRLGSGYPVKLLNYMSAARAVVSAGCGSKVLRDDVDGVVVRDDDPDAFAAAIAALRDDAARRDRLGKEARERFLRQLTWEAVLPRIEAVYDGLREPVVHARP
jgi:1,2-diacylglycerol 3-alpha-glucosyltransferase